MSIRWTRTGQVRGARMPEAIGWSKEISTWLAKKYNLTVDTWLDTVGTINSIRWSVDYPDVATFDKTMSAVLADPEYWQYIAKAMKNEIFIEGVGHDTLSRKI